MSQASAAAVDFGEADAELQQVLENLESAANYSAWIFSLLRPYLGRTVLEVGAGHGTITRLIEKEADRIVAVEPSKSSASVLRTVFEAAKKVEIVEGYIDAVSQGSTFDSAVLINVLEHIEDDDAALQGLYTRLDPDTGTLLLWVPAFRSLYGDLDRRIGHYRRYRLGQLKSQLERHGYVIKDGRYVNIVGWFAWLVVVRVLRRMPSNQSLRFADKVLVPRLAKLEARLSPPFGQSIFVAAARST